MGERFSFDDVDWTKQDSVIAREKRCSHEWVRQIRRRLSKPKALNHGRIYHAPSQHGIDFDEDDLADYIADQFAYHSTHCVCGNELDHVADADSASRCLLGIGGADLCPGCLEKQRAKWREKNKPNKAKMAREKFWLKHQMVVGAA